MNNNPINWIDPWGLVGQKSEEELWDEVNELEALPERDPAQEQRLEELHEEIDEREAIQPFPLSEDPILNAILLSQSAVSLGKNLPQALKYGRTYLLNKKLFVPNSIQKKVLKDLLGHAAKSSAAAYNPATEHVAKPAMDSAEGLLE